MDLKREAACLSLLLGSSLPIQFLINKAISLRDKLIRVYNLRTDSAPFLAVVTIKSVKLTPCILAALTNSFFR